MGDFGSLLDGHCAASFAATSRRFGKSSVNQSRRKMSAIGPKQTCRKTQSMSLLGVKRTSLIAVQMSASDPKRTFAAYETRINFYGRCRWIRTNSIPQVLKTAHIRRKTELRCYRLMTGATARASIRDMSTRHVFIALAIVLCAGVVLFAVDYQSLAPQLPSVFVVR